MPGNPYTKGLLRSVPDPTSERGTLYQISGLPPDVAHLPPGCPFAPRCDRAEDICGKEFPPLVEVNQDHHSLCHFAAEVYAESVANDVGAEKMSSELNTVTPDSVPLGIEKMEPLISIRNLTVYFDAVARAPKKRVAKRDSEEERTGHGKVSFASRGSACCRTAYFAGDGSWKTKVGCDRVSDCVGGGSVADRVQSVWSRGARQTVKAVDGVSLDIFAVRHWVWSANQVAENLHWAGQFCG